MELTDTEIEVANLPVNTDVQFKWTVDEPDSTSPESVVLEHQLPRTAVATTPTTMPATMMTVTVSVTGTGTGPAMTDAPRGKWSF